MGVSWEGQRMIAPEVEYFAEGARQYCALIETAHRYPLTERLLNLATLLADLYAAGLRLPEVEQPDDERPDLNSTAPPWEGLGDLTFYWEVGDPYQWEAPVVGSLSDDLLEIYHDLKRGLSAFEAGGEANVASAVWNWRSNFAKHWGEHAVDALRTLHRAIRRSIEEAE
jgi:Domain of unknown function (DUF5063)